MQLLVVEAMQLIGALQRPGPNPLWASETVPCTNIMQHFTLQS